MTPLQWGPIKIWFITLISMSYVFLCQHLSNDLLPSNMWYIFPLLQYPDILFTQSNDKLFSRSLTLGTPDWNCVNSGLPAYTHLGYATPAHIRAERSVRMTLTRCLACFKSKFTIVPLNVLSGTEVCSPRV